jgi:hypothetical protein
MKGCHVHVGRIEISLHPDNSGGIVFDCPFASSSAKDFDAATSVLRACLRDSQFRDQLHSAIRRAMEHMPSVQGFWAKKANGRLREFKFLLLALGRMG